MFQNIADWLSTNLVGLIQGIVGIWLATVATIALNTWKHQLKANKQADFLDELTEEIHQFIESLVPSISIIKFTQIGIESHKDMPDLDNSLKHPEAVRYIEKHGEKDSKQLYEKLEVSSKFVSRIRALSVKGQVLGFKDYSKCMHSCHMLITQYNRIQAFADIIGRTSLNWSHPEVESTLNKILSVTEEDLKLQTEGHHVGFLEFAKSSYEKLYR